MYDTAVIKNQQVRVEIDGDNAILTCINFEPTAQQIEAVRTSYDIKGELKVELEVRLNIPVFAFFGDYKSRYTEEQIRTRTRVLTGDEAVEYIRSKPVNRGMFERKSEK